MAKSRCPKCEASKFEIIENVPTGSAYKFMFIQCSSCGTVVGVTEYFNAGALLHKIMKKLGVN